MPVFIHIEEIVRSGFHAEPHVRETRERLQPRLAAFENVKEDIISSKILSPALYERPVAARSCDRFSLASEGRPRRAAHTRLGKVSSS